MEVIYNKKNFGLTSTMWEVRMMMVAFIVEMKQALWIKGHYAEWVNECTLDAIPLSAIKKQEEIH